ncbi:MAG: esterase-like activity of phytase family protein [Bacteroidetes bacterium]|nr:esterase-like activity of phytase family protein [Bacteroidota bacterium]
MLKQKFNHKLLLFCFALLLSRANAQIVKGTDYQNYYSAPIGTFQGINFREAGFSGLYVIPGTDGKEFWTCSDRGVNIDAANANLPGCRPTYDKIYSFPTYAPKIHRIRIQGDSIQILRTINVRRPNNTHASGIFNPTGLGSTALEIPSTDTVQDCANFLTKTTNKDTFGLDPEGIVLDKNGNFWLCEEGGPTIWKLNPNGKLITRYTPYAHLAGAQSVDVAIDTVFGYRKNNRGFEGISLTPSGKIYAIIQSPILYPTKTAGENTRVHRILEIDPTTNSTRMFAYLNDGIIGASGSNQIRLRDLKIGDMAAINDSTFLVLEAALRGTTDIKRLYHININQATVVHSGLYGDLTLEQLVDSTGLAAQNIKPVQKTLAMDLLANGWPTALEKAEGIAILNDSTVFIGNDNDYGQVSLPENGVAAATGFTSHIIAYQFKGINKLKNHTQPIQDMQFGKTGMQSSTSPYLISTKSNASFTSLLTVGDAVGGYRMVGLPDGTGAFDNGNGTFTFLINHELGNTLGINRKHGTKGAFISQWVFNKSEMTIVSGSDLIKNVKLWNGSSFSSFDTLNPGLAFSRFCAADMPEISALYNSNTGKGTQERIFLNGEEAGPTGRAFAHIATGVNAGTSYELPALGKFSWENALACPTKSDTTIVIGTDDATPGQVYVYLGVKSSTGNEVEKAGLIGGNLYGVAVSGLPIETSGSMISPNTKFTLFPFGNVNNMTGGALDTASNNAGVTRFLRPEDAAWDPKYPNDFYFVTTNGFTSPSRMYRLRFDNILNPSLGGKITAVLDGTEGPKMMDNVCFDKKGHMMIQEDPGNVSHHAKIWKYTPATDKIELIATHDSTRFTAGCANYLTQDEESSGIIDMQDILGAGKFLLVDQAHYSLGGELVEGGQILLYTTTDTMNEFVAMNVASNKIQIAHNDITPSTTDNTDFGNVKSIPILLKHLPFSIKEPLR